MGHGVTPGFFHCVIPGLFGTPAYVEKAVASVSGRLMYPVCNLRLTYYKVAMSWFQPMSWFGTTFRSML